MQENRPENRFSKRSNFYVLDGRKKSDSCHDNPRLETFPLSSNSRLQSDFFPSTTGAAESTFEHPVEIVSRGDLCHSIHRWLMLPAKLNHVLLCAHMQITHK